MTARKNKSSRALRLTEKGQAVARAAAQERVAAFNAQCTVGTKVRYHHVIGQTEFTEHATRSEALVLESGQAVVWVAGRAGCVALEAVEVVKEEQKQECLHRFAEGMAFDLYCGEFGKPL